MSTEAVERSSIWADEAVLLLIKIWADEKIQWQLDIYSKSSICDKMAKLWLHQFTFPSKKIEDSNSLSGRK